MNPAARPESIKAVEDAIRSLGLRPFLNPGVERKVIAVLGEMGLRKADLVERFSIMPDVDRVELDLGSSGSLASRTIIPRLGH